MVEVSDLNPLSKFGLGDIGIGTIGTWAISIILILLVFAGIGTLIYFWYRKKIYKYKIHLFARIGNSPTRVGIYKARNLPMGKAGDSLWFVSGLNKYIPPATIQSAPNEFWHWIREDGEWINFDMQDLDENSKKAGVHYIHQDMRMQRLATDRLLEQRLLKKKFWEKWGVVIGYVIFFLVITVAMVIIFYQFGKIVTQVGLLIDKLGILITIKESGGKDSLIPITPALISLFLKSVWRKNGRVGK